MGTRVLKVEVTGEPDAALLGFAAVAKMLEGWTVEFVQPGESERAKKNAENIWASPCPTLYLEP